MFANIEILIALLEKIGIAALLVLVYRMIRRSKFGLLWGGPIIGVLFGLGAAITMIDPVEIAPGVIIDTRTVMVGLAALFGGIWAAVISAAISIVVRLFLGGAGAVPGVFAIVMAAAIALIYSKVTNRRTDVKGLAILGACLSLNLLTVLLVPWELASAALSAFPTVLARNLIGTIVLGYLLAIEDRREDEYLAVKRQADHDPLTGLYNRRALTVMSAQLEAHAQSSSSLFSVILFDIDYFKRLNDSYGHAFGDQVLAGVAKIIAGRMRQRDLVVRFGGEEICVIVPDSNGRNTARVAEDIRCQVAGAVFDLDNQPVSVTVSAGVAQSGGAIVTVADVLKNADKALYEAKGAGRNRVFTYEADAPLPSGG